MAANKLLKDPKKLQGAFGFAGHNGAGACTLTGAKVGQKAQLIFDASGATLDAAPLFEDTISVKDQIQQLSASDLSAKKYIVVLE